MRALLGRAVPEPEGLERVREEVLSSEGEAFLQRSPTRSPADPTLALSKKLWASRVSSEVNKEVKEEEALP